MDHETADDIKRHFNVVAQGLRSETGGLRSEIRTVVEGQRVTVERLDRLEGRVEGEVGGLRSEIRTVVEGQRATVDRLDRLEGRVEIELGDTRRHFNVVAEGLRSEIRTVAEGLQGFREEVGREFSAVRADISELKTLNSLAFTDVNRRISSNESDLTNLHARMERVEGGRKT